jgi:hypothetical protein
MLSADLGGQFAGRHQHQRADAPPALDALRGQLLKHGQGEARRLAGARLGAGQHVATLEDHGDGLQLDGGWRSVAFVGYRTKQLGRKAEGIK